MKRVIIFYFLLLVTLVSAYIFNVKTRDVIKEQKELIAHMEQKDSLLSIYMQTFNEIETNLETIKERESTIGLMANQNLEYGKDKKSSILLDIKAIDLLLKENRSKLANLNESLYESSEINLELKRAIEILEKRNKEQELQVKFLQEQVVGLVSEKRKLSANISQLENSVDTLLHLTNFYQAVVETQREDIETAEWELNKVFYRIDNKDVLKKDNIIQRDKGIIGLGLKLTLADEIDSREFVSAHKDRLVAIPLETQKVQLITDHPEGSYSVNSENDEQSPRLLILDPDKFWQKSRYLVVASK